jgi:hypothetical protein
MGLGASVKGLSAITTILIIVISAVVGGIISYAFTIAYYTDVPEKTTLAITGIYINPQNVRSLNITVLNPSYSPGDANITRVALSLKNGTKLYNVVETSPSIKNGLKIRRGESINITCLKLEANMTLGEFVSEFAGEKILVHVFAEGSPAANMEAKLPYVKLGITTDFNPRVSFKRFNITLTNSPSSEVNLTVIDIVPGVITFREVYPDFRLNPVPLQKNETVCFQFENASWHGYVQFMLSVYTEQGYVFHKEVKVETVHAAVQSVVFDANNTDLFKVTVYNFAESTTPVNVKEVRCLLENGTALSFPCNLAELPPNTTREFTFSWNWRDYRGKNVTVVAYFAQEFETDGYRAVTPPPVILKVLEAAKTFNLKDKEHFNITILNHPSSIRTVNVTRIVVKQTGEVLNVTDGLVRPGFNKTFCCTFSWTGFLKNHGRNLTLTVYATDNQTFEYAFDFSFTLPVAELNIAAVETTAFGETRYLNITIRNVERSLWNITLSKVIVEVQGLTEPLVCMLPEGQVVVKVGGETVLLFPFDWQKYMGKSIIVTVVAVEELAEASATYTIPDTVP